jgi:hypothetical protein
MQKTINTLLLLMLFAQSAITQVAIEPDSAILRKIAPLKPADLRNNLIGWHINRAETYLVNGKNYCLEIDQLETWQPQFKASYFVPCPIAVGNMHIVYKYYIGIEGIIHKYIIKVDSPYRKQFEYLMDYQFPRTKQGNGWIEKAADGYYLYERDYIPNMRYWIRVSKITGNAKTYTNRTRKQ